MRIVTAPTRLTLRQFGLDPGSGLGKSVSDRQRRASMLAMHLNHWALSQTGATTECPWMANAANLAQQPLVEFRQRVQRLANALDPSENEETCFFGWEFLLTAGLWRSSGTDTAFLLLHRGFEEECCRLADQTALPPRLAEPLLRSWLRLLYRCSSESDIVLASLPDDESEIATAADLLALEARAENLPESEMKAADPLPRGVWKLDMGSWDAVAEAEDYEIASSLRHTGTPHPATDDEGLPPARANPSLAAPTSLRNYRETRRTELREIGRMTRAGGAESEPAREPFRPIRSLRRAYYNRKFPHFDEDFYLENYPDIAAAGVDPLLHYGIHGHKEGRSPCAKRIYDPPWLKSTDHFDPARHTVLVGLHDGTRTGAPLIGFNLVLSLLQHYNVVTLALEPGPLVTACASSGAAVLTPTSRMRTFTGAATYLRKVLSATTIRFAIVNSMASRSVLPSLKDEGIPSLLLVHEFAIYTGPAEEFGEMMYLADTVVFPSEIVRRNAIEFHTEARSEHFHVIPQGLCVFPEAQLEFEGKLGEWETEAEVRQRLGLEARGPAPFVVAGIGWPIYRKGIDLFIQCARDFIARNPDIDAQFVWVGASNTSGRHGGLSAGIRDQLARSGLGDRFAMAGEIHNMGAVYESIDVLAMTSRFDPMPNVTIEAFHAGVPVVCFENTTGASETLEAAGVVNECIAGYLDTSDMAGLIAKLARDEALRKEVAEKSQRTARDQFQMERYCDTLRNLGEALVEEVS